MQDLVREGEQDIVVVQCEIGWFARSRSQRLAAVGKTPDDARNQLQSVLNTLAKLTEKRKSETQSENH